MKQRFIVDTSIWIDYLRDSEKQINRLVESLIDENKICINGIIKTELLLGTKNKADYKSLSENLKGLNYLDIDEFQFNSAAKTGFELKRKGISVPLSDLIIAAQCNHFGLCLIAKDKHYELIQKSLDFELSNY